MSSTAELDERQALVCGVRRCAASPRFRYGQTPATRRVVLNAGRIIPGGDLLDHDADDLNMARCTAKHSVEKIFVPDTQYGSEFWRDDLRDEGVGGHHK